MATTSVDNLIARARTIATQMGGDANLSPLIDNKFALRTLLNNAINHVYTKRAGDGKSWRDISIRFPITIASGFGTFPSNAMREFMHQSDWANSDNDLISYIARDADNRETYDTYLGYVQIQGDTVLYTPPNGDATSYTGTLYMTAVGTPELPASSSTTFNMTSDISDEVAYTLALALRGEISLI